MDSTSVEPKPWIPYAPALSSGSPVATYSDAVRRSNRRNRTRTPSTAHAIRPPGATTATPVSTRCSRPWSRSSISTASSAPRGLPRTTSSTTTIVSLPTTIASGRFAATACAFSRASRSACRAGGSPGTNDSSTSAGTMSKRSPSIRANEARRGEPDASTSGTPQATSPRSSLVSPPPDPARPPSTPPSPLEEQRDRARVHQLHVHHGAELPGLHPARQPLAHDLHELLVQRDRHLRRRRLHEARTTTLPRIPVERELAHHQHLPAHLLQVQVHLPGLVR